MPPFPPPCLLCPVILHILPSLRASVSTSHTFSLPPSFPPSPLSTYNRNKRKNLHALKDAFDRAVGLSEEEKQKVEKEVQEAMRIFDASVKGEGREGGRMEEKAA